RIIERMEERLGQFVDQLTNQMNDLMNNRRPRNRRHKDEDEESEESPFGDSSSSDEQSVERPRRNQKEDNRRWESGMRVNIPDFDGDTLNPRGFIDWLAAIEEVIQREREDQLVSRYIGGLRVQIMDSVNMFDPMTLSDAFQHALAFEKQNRRVGSSSSPAITGVSGLGNACKKDGKRHLFDDPEDNDDDVAYGDYEAAPFYDEEPEYEEEYVSGDVGVNLVVRRSCLTPKADGDDWLKHNIFQSTCTILGKVCTFVYDSVII
nr:hypothetical protein [Tanacetum cinerariifolium]